MNPLYNAFVYLVWFLATYYLVLLMLAMLAYRKQLYAQPASLGRTPRVTFLVPAYNEEEDIAATIASLKNVTYPRAEFIVMSDGSTDATAAVARETIAGDKRFKLVDRKNNLGKASTHNEGIRMARGEFIACMDADSTVPPGIVEQVLPYFSREDVGAVTVSVEVANDKRFLNRIFDIEFIIGLSLLLKVFSFFDSIFVTPGPFSMYRKSMLDEIGGFDPSNVTEDLEIAYRIHKAGYRIENSLVARVRTSLPETFKGAYVQRRRWYAGAIQTLIQHRDMFLRPRYGMFAFVMPFNYLIIFSGIALFFMSTWMTIHSLWTTLYSFRYTGFNILSRLGDIDLDLLRLGTINLFGTVAFASTIVLMIVGLVFTHKLIRRKGAGMLGYPLLFFLYQVFWIGAIYNVVRGRKIKWR